MKFMNAKKVRDYANELHELRKKKAKLREEMRALVAEQEALEQFLYEKAEGEDFRFNGTGADSEWVKEVLFQPRERMDLNDERIRRDYARLGKDVPMKKSEWTEVKVRYATEA